jgi:hypothetical protein
MGQLGMMGVVRQIEILFDGEELYELFVGGRLIHAVGRGRLGHSAG